MIVPATRAVFLSYASEDAQAARRIAEALKAGGIEAWFDQSELRGGDEWDAQIRRQIKACGLFMPIISARTHARTEGYFRLEWKLAIDRSHLMAPGQPFLVPVVIDDTPHNDERIPERFREMQWTRLPAGETPASFVERIQRLLTPEAQTSPPPGARATDPVTTSAPTRGGALSDGVPSGGSRARGRRGALLAGAIAAVALLAVGYLGFVRLKGSGSPRQVSPSIAVLPFANESGDAGQQYFSDGISEDLITALSQFTGLKVIGRTSAFQFRDSKEDSRSIGAKLGVAHLLEGSVRKSGDMIRVSAELIDTADGTTQWSERYDRAYKELFALQDEITRAVTGALKTKLLPTAQAAEQSDRPPSGSLEAYNEFLQGRFYAARFTEADQRKAIEYFTQATQIDPHYALAWSWLSIQRTGVAESYLEGQSAQDAYVQARAAAEKAIALAPELAAAHSARGALLRVADFNWRAAEAEFRRALELSPNSDLARLYLANLLASLGQMSQAVELTRQSILAEPLNASRYTSLSIYLAALDRLDEAEQAVRRAIELRPTAASYHEQLASIEIQRGHADAALDAAQREPAGVWQDIALALARQIGSDREAANAALKTLIEKDGVGAAYQVAQVYALRQDADRTFEWLDRAWSNHDPGITGLLYDPLILRYRSDPRFAAFCRKVSLPPPASKS